MSEQELDTCLDGCGVLADERNRYFTGKCMTARDFRGDQSYFLTHHRLHNRLLHGWGIVCGLRVVHHRSRDCAEWAVVRSGVALDCCGRELVLPSDTSFKLPLPQRRDEGQQAQQGYEDDERPNGPFLLCLRYAEEEIEHLPVLYQEGECDPTRREANRIREVALIEVRELEKVERGCWRSIDTGMDAPCRDDCDEEIPAAGYGCLEPWCPCGSCVPLALIASTDDDDEERRFTIDMSGRRQLPLPPDYVTRVVGINWPHGGELTLEDLADLDGRLEVRFDRHLLPADGDATGINEYTFVVQYGNIQRDLEFLPWERDNPPGLLPDDECVATFPIDPGYIDADDRNNIGGAAVYVALKCDFILDCHGNPVSGKHLGGRLPSGDGSPGGIFESWFRVVPGRYGREA